MKKLAYEFLKSGLSINTHIGCSLHCAYCVLDNIDGFPQKPLRIESPKVLVENIDCGLLYVENLTPIYINNRTDPFLPEVINDTYEILRLLQNRSIKSPVILITKLAPDARITDFFNNLNLIIIYTYTNLKGLDYNSNRLINKKNIDQLQFYVPKKNRFHYYRPIIPGLNDDRERFIEALKEVGIYFNTTIIGGIRVVKNNLFLPKDLYYNKSHKFLEDSIFEETSELAQEYGINIVRHTSCAISIFMSSSNKLGYFGKKQHCKSSCKNYDFCNKKYFYTDEYIYKLLNQTTNVKYKLEKGTVKFLEPVSQEIIALLRSSLGIRVEAKDVVLSYSEKKLET